MYRLGLGTVYRGVGTQLEHSIDISWDQLELVGVFYSIASTPTWIVAEFRDFRDFVVLVLHQTPSSSSSSSSGASKVKILVLQKLNFPLVYCCRVYTVS